MIARPRCPDRKRTAACRPTNRKKSTRSRVEKGAPFRVKGGAALPVQKGARFRGVYQLRQGRFREGAGNRRSAGRARLQMLDRAARCAPGPLLRRLDHQGHRAGAVLHSCAVEREQQLGFRLARDRARREQEQAHFHGARGGRAGPAPALELFVSSTQWIDAFEGRLAPHIDQLAQQLADDDDVATPEDWRPPTRTSASRPPWRSPYVLGGGAAVLAALALGAFFLTRPTGDFTLEREACMNLSGAAGIAACDRAIASGKFSGSDAAYLLARRGYERQARNDLAGALADYSEAIRLDPRLAMAFNNRGNIYRDQGDYDRALADYDRALALDPAKPDPLASRGWVLSQKGEMNARGRTSRRRSPSTRHPS